jgi:hypothetical protein
MNGGEKALKGAAGITGLLILYSTREWHEHTDNIIEWGAWEYLMASLPWGLLSLAITDPIRDIFRRQKHVSWARAARGLTDDGKVAYYVWHAVCVTIICIIPAIIFWALNSENPNNPSTNILAFLFLLAVLILFGFLVPTIPIMMKAIADRIAGFKPFDDHAPFNDWSGFYVWATALAWVAGIAVFIAWSWKA